MRYGTSVLIICHTLRRQSERWYLATAWRHDGAPGSGMWAAVVEFTVFTIK